MKNKPTPGRFTVGSLAALLALVFAAGCQTGNKECCKPATETAAAAAAPAAAPVATAPAAQSLPTIRIKAGVTAPVKDSSGNEWLADRGFADGETVERSDVQIQNTKTPAIYMAERFSMTAFSQPLPNGKYVVKLHFAETFEGITAAGERVFSFNVEGHEFKNFDVYAKAGGAFRAYVETVPVEIKDGKLDITFTPNVENPEINGIEILPGS